MSRKVNKYPNFTIESVIVKYDGENRIEIDESTLSENDALLIHKQLADKFMKSLGYQKLA